MLVDFILFYFLQDTPRNDSPCGLETSLQRTTRHVPQQLGDGNIFNTRDQTQGITQARYVFYRSPEYFN